MKEKTQLSRQRENILLEFLNGYCHNGVGRVFFATQPREMNEKNEFFSRKG